MKNPKISVIMSVLNAEKLLEHSIQNILLQTFKNFEFIIVNDGSTDKSLNILREYEKRDNRIRIFNNHKNIGLTKSLNRAISLSNGKYIARQDADDFSLRNRLEKQFNFLEKFPDYAFCGTNGSFKGISHEFIHFYSHSNILRNLIIDNCFSHSSIMIRKNIFDKYGKYDQNFRYSQDYELWCRLILKYKLKAVNLRDKLLIRNTSSNNIKRRFNKKFIQQRINSIKIQIKYLKYTNNKGMGLISIGLRVLEIILSLNIIPSFSLFSRNHDL